MLAYLAEYIGISKKTGEVQRPASASGTPRMYAADNEEEIPHYRKERSNNKTYLVAKRLEKSHNGNIGLHPCKLINKKMTYYFPFKE